MASKNKKKGTKRHRRSNPSTRRVAIGAAVGLATLGVIGLGYASYRSRKAKLPKRRTPPALPPLEGQGAPAPASGAVGAPCEKPDLYPGFVWDGDSCVPSAQTPPGIYIVSDCRDFIFVRGDASPQINAIDALVETSSVPPDSPDDPGVDAVVLATMFMTQFWPQCPWPPPVDASPRVVNLFMALSLLFGRAVILAGGRVLGTSDPDQVDANVAEQLQTLGYADFDPSLVPEIELPKLPDDGGEGFIPPEPKPGGGGIVGSEGGGVTPPSQQPGNEGGKDAGGWKPTETPDCETIATTRNLPLNMPPVSWTERKTLTIELLKQPSSDCTQYQVAFGICVGGDQTFGVLDQSLADPSQHIDFAISNSNGTPLSAAQWQSFNMPIWWKGQWKLKIRYINGKVQIVDPGNPLVAVSYKEMDPCPNATARWPSSASGGYSVQTVDGSTQDWDPMPRLVGVQSDGNRLLAKLEYSGLPQFTRIDQTHARARVDRTTDFNARLKVWYVGIAS